MDLDVAEWVKTCVTCQQTQPRQGYPMGLLQPHRVPSRLWEVVSIDFVTGLPMTQWGVNAFATFTCKLSKMVHVVPMTYNGNSVEVVVRLFMDTIWRLHGAPMKIVCDRDPRFRDAMTQEFMRLMGVKVASTTPYHPQSDGQAERTATGFSPFELVYGHATAMQLDFFMDATLEGGSRKRKGGHVAVDKRGTTHELAKQFARQLQAARVNLHMVQQRMIEQFDARHRLQQMKVNDQVWVDGQHLTFRGDRGLKLKLRKLRHGPLRIVECLYSDRQQELPEQDRGAPSAYRLELPVHGKVHDVFTADRLTPVQSGAKHFVGRQEEMAPPPVMVEGQREREVERIIGTRFRKLGGKAGGTVQEWLTKWKGLPHSHNQWRTREDLEGKGGRLEPLRVFEADEERRKRAPEKRRRETHKGQEEQRAQLMAIGPPTPTVYNSSLQHGKQHALEDILHWNYKLYPRHYFDVVWASPPCKEYSTAKTRGAPDLELADRRVQRTRAIIEYYAPAYFFIENPAGDALRGLHTRAVMKGEDLDDWRLNQWFEWASKQWGPFTVDRFASEISAQLPRYYAETTDPWCEGGLSGEFNEDGKAHVQYGNGDEETLDLFEENFKIICSSGVTDETADVNGENIDCGGDCKENKRGGAVENFLTHSLCERWRNELGQSRFTDLAVKMQQKALLDTTLNNYGLKARRFIHFWRKDDGTTG
eukprot:gene2724-biopygen2663